MESGPGVCRALQVTVGKLPANEQAAAAAAAQPSVIHPCHILRALMEMENDCPVGWAGEEDCVLVLRLPKWVTTALK